VLGWSLNFSLKHTDVILCLAGVLQGNKAQHILLRSDKGSPFSPHNLGKYSEQKNITHVSTPQENAYVESLFSQVEREVIQRYEFESLYHARDIFHRYFNWHNHKRRRHAFDRVSPLDYGNTIYPCHSFKPPAAQIRSMG
jgi:transposase InsO family protein